MTGRSADKLKALEAEFQAEGITTAVIDGDPAIEADMKKVVDFAVDTFGELNILAVCHGVNAPKGILEQSVEDWQKIMDAISKASTVVCKAAAERMVAQNKGGKIVVTSSAAAKWA